MSEEEMQLRAECLSWLADGDKGISSKTMAFCACDIEYEKQDHPYDPDDLNRCIKLVNRIPKIKAHFPKIATISKEWKAIIEHWDDLVEIFIDEVGFDWCEARSAPVTYERMQLLLT